MKKIILLIFLFVTPANAIDLQKYYKEPLTNTDKKGIVIFNMLQGIDMLQTLSLIHI